MISNNASEDNALDIASIAAKSMLYEVTCFPSPGLVSINSNGAHKDMDYYTFIDSTSILIKYLFEITKCSFSNKSPKSLFNEIRQIGIVGEKSMLKATKGVNTHRGMFFLMGICCAAAGKLIYEKKSFSNFRPLLIAMCSGIVENELITGKPKETMTHGEKLYARYKTYGIRGQVESGLPIIFEYSLELYKSEIALNTNDRLVHTLMGIMQFCEDSNVMYRHSKEVLCEVQAKARYIMELGGMTTKEGIAAINSLNHEFSIRNISPGGSADMLGTTVFIAAIEKYISLLYNS
jgi:triphosphoribosyl-dephospho-CoA synthase